MIKRKNLNKGNVIYFKDIPMIVDRCDKDEVKLKCLNQSIGSVYAQYEDLYPIPLGDVKDEMENIQGLTIELLKGDYYHIDYFGDSFVNRFLHSFMTQFRQKYRTDFPIHKIFKK